MLSTQDIERFRKMTPAERLKIGLELTNLAWRFLSRLPPAEIKRRLELARQPWNPPPINGRGS